MSVVGYAYPWDVVGDPAAAQRMLDVGVDAIALAANYHATRAATPFHPEHRFVDVEHAACYLPVRTERWRGRRLVPAQPSWVGPDSFRHARDELRRVGLPVHAWIVLTHNSLLGTRHAEYSARNAFGEPLRHGLCPAHDEVVDYCTTLVAEIVDLGEPDGVILEACGPMGAAHAGLHDKADLAGWSPVDWQLLSICFCSACADVLAGEKVDPSVAAAAVRAAIGSAAASVPQALGVELANRLGAARRRGTASLRRRVLETVRERTSVPITLHASAAPWATGSFAWTDAEHGCDVLVASCWTEPAADAARSLAHIRGGARVGAYVRPDTSTRAADELMRDCVAAGLDELHLYHLGLAGPEGLRRLAACAAAFRIAQGH